MQWNLHRNHANKWRHLFFIFLDIMERWFHMEFGTEYTSEILLCEQGLILQYMLVQWIDVQ